MNIIDIITKKKNKEILTEEEIKYVIENFVNGNIKDYQQFQRINEYGKKTTHKSACSNRCI